jgi:drug/metabolite transporter (DMT)-like permease
MNATDPARPPKDRRAQLAIGLVILSMLGFAGMDAMSKLLASTYAITQILWVRYIVFAVFAIALVRRAGVLATAHSNRPWLQGTRALLLVMENAVFVLAFMFLPLAEVHAIAAASPLIVVALAAPLLGEKVDVRRWLAVLAGFLGVLAIVRPGFRTADWHILVPLAGALMWGMYQILVRLCSRTDSAGTTLLWSAGVGLAATTLTGPLQWTNPDATGWALLMGVALAGSLAHYALIKALGYAEATVLQPYSYALLVFATLFGLAVFGHVPDAWTIGGAVIIVASGLYSWHRDRLRIAQA